MKASEKPALLGLSTHARQRARWGWLILLVGFLPGLDGATIQIGPVTVSNGAQFVVPILADVGNAPLGRYEISVSYDASSVRFVRLAQGHGHLATPTVNASVPGQFRACANNTRSLSFPTGVVQVAVMILEPIRDPGSSSPVSFGSVTLLRADNVTPVTTTSIDGTIVIPGSTVRLNEQPASKGLARSETKRGKLTLAATARPNEKGMK